MRIKSITILGVIVFIVYFLLCTKKIPEDQAAVPETVKEVLRKPIKLSEVILSGPASPLSVRSPIELEFREQVVPKHMSGVILDKNPFVFTPEIKGNASWIQDKILRFTPQKTLPPGVMFKGLLKGGIAVGENRKVDDFSFSFKTAEQEIISFTGDFEPDPKSGKNYIRYRAQIQFAQEISHKDILKDLQCIRKRIKVKITTSIAENDPRRVIVESEPLLRGKKGYTLFFSLPEQYTAGGKKWQKEVHIPESNVFKVLTHMELSEPGAEQLVYGFRFTDQIKTDMDLSGYIEISPDIDFKVSVDGKYLLIKGIFAPGMAYSAKIKKGLPNMFNLALTSDYHTKFTFENIKPQIELLSQGVILPTSNKYKLQFKSVNIDTISIRIYEILPKNTGFFLQKNFLKSGFYQTATSHGYYRRNYRYKDIERVSDEIHVKKFAISSEVNQWVNSEVDFSAVFKNKNNSVFIIGLEFDKDDLCGTCTNSRDSVDAGMLFFDRSNYFDNPCSNGYYNRNGRKTTLLIASDIGLTIKKSRDGIHAFAINVINGKPRAGVECGLYSYQNKLLSTAVTDARGHLLFKENIKKGSYIRGRKEHGLVMFKLNKPSWEITNYDVGGASDGEEGINVFTYTERGVYRPGDTIHFSCIVRNSRKNPDPKAPVLLTVFNARSQKAYEAKGICGENGMVYFAIPTETSDPTGNWRAQIEIGGKKIFHELKVEMVKPNRFKVAFSVSDTFYLTGSLEGMIEAKYLFGTPAAQCKATVDAYLENRSLILPAYPDYQFNNPGKKYKSRKKTLFEDNLDDVGKASLTLEEDHFSDASQLIGALLTATVFEKGGGFTRQSKRITLVPYSAFVGFKSPFKYDRAKTGEKYTIPIVCVDAAGKPVSGHKLTVKHYFNRRYWWWDYRSRGRRDFRTLMNTSLIDESQLVSSNTAMKYNINLEDQGQHYIEIINETSGHSSAFLFYASRWGYQSVDTKAESDRNYLSISTNKNIYAPGDELKLSFPSPEQGSALVSIEVSDRILKQKVIALSAESTSVSFKVNEEMVPNCYAVVSMIQSHSNVNNDVPLRIYGIKPVFVEDNESYLPLSVSLPEELKPNQEFTLDVTSSAEKAASYTVAIVDDGLLDLTGFSTPDPWKFYYRKIRLGVKTSDNYDEIIGLMQPDMDRYFSIGGSEAGIEKRAGASRERRFIPVVLFKGPVQIDPGKTNTHTFTMPNYVGSVRLMIVAAAGKSFTRIEKTAHVRSPLMLLPTLPRVARPLEKFKLPVSVFAMEESVRDVTVELTVSKELNIQGSRKFSLLFNKPGERDTAFTIKVGESMGNAKVIVSARSDTYKASDTTILPLNAPNPFYTDVFDTTIEDGGIVTLPIDPIGIPGTNSASVAVTRIPDLQLTDRLNYLIRYPYGCIEQTVSSVFPQLYMGSLIELTSYQKQNSTDNINTAIKRLGKFTLPKGGFSYWPGREKYSDWGTTYGTHFLVEARNAGYNVPESLMKRCFMGIQRYAKKSSKKNHRLQAYRLFVLALAGKTNQGAMNLMRENYLSSMDPLSRIMLATTYYIAGQKDIAEELFKHTPTEITHYRETGGSFGSSLRDRAMIACCYIKMNKTGEASKLIKKLCREFKPGYWYSTQETAIALLALSTMYHKSPFTGGDIPFTIKIPGEKIIRKTCKGFQTQVDISSAYGKKITISTAHSDPLFITILREGIPLHDTIKAGHSNLELARNLYNDDGDLMGLGDIKRGKPFWIHLRVRGITGEYIENVELSNMIPSGWEIINLRLEGLDYPEWVKNLGVTEGTYMDIRDDRINWFFNLDPRTGNNFLARINPSFIGTYKLPPVVVEAMYSPDYFARLPSRQVSVK